jgi:DNA mismatch endonuclease (patch repair protein)
MDNVAPAVRSRIMSSVGRRDTRPEVLVRQLLHSLGYRFRLHRRDLPGTPDVVLPRHQLAVFVHGCFWHRHAGCRRTTTPADNRDYWLAKFGRNVARDRRNRADLRRAGWRVLVVWECEVRNPERLTARLRRAVEGA